MKKELNKELYENTAPRYNFFKSLASQNLTEKKCFQKNK